MKIKEILVNIGWASVGVVILFFWVKSCYFDNLKSERDEAKNKLYITNIVDSLTKSTDANNSWLAELCDADNFRWNDILTIEMEYLWLSNKPILFTGFISDIKTTNSDFYEITINHSWDKFDNFEVFTDFNLVLQSHKSKIDKLLDKNLQLIQSSRIAVVANINKVEPTKYLDYEYEVNDGFIGYGDLTEIISLNYEN